jgi:hypothetical protein
MLGLCDGPDTVHRYRVGREQMEAADGCRRRVEGYRELCWEWGLEMEEVWGVV